MTSCPSCSRQLSDSITQCPACGDKHMLVRSQSGIIVARVSQTSAQAFPSISSGLTASDEDNTPAEFVIEPVAEPVVAFRIWSIDTDNTYAITQADMRDWAKAWDEGRNPFLGMAAPWLEGVGVDSLWAKPSMEAECKAPNQDVRHLHPPVPECSCGIWALKDERFIPRTIAKYEKPRCAWGTVLMWGRIVETEFGYRSQYAQPIKIFVKGISEEEAVEMAIAYECEVVIADKIPELTKEDKAIQEAEAQTLLNASMQFQANISQLQQAFVSMGPAAASAAANLKAASNAKLQQHQAAISALMVSPAEILPPPKSFFESFFNRWLYLGLAVFNFALAMLFDPIGWISLAVAIGCFAIAIPQFRPLKKLAKLAVFLPALIVCPIVWMLMMGVASLADWLFLEDKKVGHYGYAETWVDKHDPVEWLMNRFS